MNLIWRFLWTMLFSRFDSKESLFDESETSYRVLLTDVDILLHMNNGRYFSFMDLARINFMIRANLYPKLRENKVYPVIASEMIRFKKSINLFQKFQLTSRLMGWDDKFFYIVHHFKVKNEVCSLSLVKACFLGRGQGIVKTNEILKLGGIEQASPNLPDWIKHWQHADQTFHDETFNN